jgi:putative intracellular protease/amidase
MGNIAYVLLPRGLADWEPALVMVKINSGTNFKIVTVGFSKSPVTSIGGMTALPDIELSEVDIDSAAAFIIPGAKFWEDNDTPEDLSNLLVELHERKIPIAVICAATLIPARLGMYKGTKHTSNSVAYLKERFPDYGDERTYIDTMAASDNGLITASGLGYVEFAVEILKSLNILKSDDEARAWHDLVKHGIVPDG